MAKKILVVDDEEVIVEGLKDILEDFDYEVVTANNGLIALQQVSKEKPNLILLDLMMPEMNGYEVCDKVRKDPEVSATPIVILSSKGEQKDIDLAFSLGATEYIIKPYNMERLLETLKKILGE